MMFWFIVIVLFLAFIFTVIGLAMHLPWILSLIGIVWGLSTGGFFGYTFALICLVVLGIWEGKRDGWLL
jgi:hypothetical protein